MIITVTFFCSKAIEEGDKSCHCLFFFLKHKEEGDGNKLPLPLSLQHHQRRR